MLGILKTLHASHAGLPCEFSYIDPLTCARCRVDDARSCHQHFGMYPTDEAFAAATLAAADCPSMLVYLNNYTPLELAAGCHISRLNLFIAPVYREPSVTERVISLCWLLDAARLARHAALYSGGMEPDGFVSGPLDLNPAPDSHADRLRRLGADAEAWRPVAVRAIAAGSISERKGQLFWLMTACEQLAQQTAAAGERARARVRPPPGPARASAPPGRAGERDAPAARRRQRDAQHRGGGAPRLRPSRGGAVGVSAGRGHARLPAQLLARPRRAREGGL